MAFKYSDLLNLIKIKSRMKRYRTIRNFDYFNASIRSLAKRTSGENFETALQQNHNVLNINYFGIIRQRDEGKVADKVADTDY